MKIFIVFFCLIVSAFGYRIKHPHNQTQPEGLPTEPLAAKNLSSSGNSTQLLPTGQRDARGFAIANHQSQSSAGAFGHASSSGVAEAHNTGFGGAVANQQSSSEAGFGGSASSSGKAVATSGFSGLRFKRNIPDQYSPFRRVARNIHGGIITPGSTSISQQSSHVSVGSGGTGIAHGQSSANNNGLGGAISTQTSSARGGPGALVVADGSSSSNVGGSRVFRAARRVGGSTSVSQQSSEVRVGNGGTGIAHGQSVANNNGLGGAISSQTSSAHGSHGSLVVADGSSSSNVGGGITPLRNKREALAPAPISNKALPPSTQQSDALGGAVQGLVTNAVSNALKNSSAVVVSSSVSATNDSDE